MDAVKSSKPSKKTSTAAKKTAPTKKASVTKKATATKPGTRAKKIAASPRTIGAEERYKMIEVAAYYIAERDQFKGSAIDYWIAAEAEIDLIMYTL